MDILFRYLPIIKKYYPVVREEKIGFYDNGHDHYVFVVGGKHAFRFPRSSDHGKQTQEKFLLEINEYIALASSSFL